MRARPWPPQARASRSDCAMDCRAMRHQGGGRRGSASKISTSLSLRRRRQAERAVGHGAAQQAMSDRLRRRQRPTRRCGVLDGLDTGWTDERRDRQAGDDARAARRSSAGSSCGEQAPGGPVMRSSRGSRRLDAGGGRRSGGSADRGDPRAPGPQRLRHADHSEQIVASSRGSRAAAT